MSAQAAYAAFAQARLCAEDGTRSINSPNDLAPLFKRWAGARQEQFLVLTLDGAHQPMHVYRATVGLVNRTCVHPREVFYHAIRDNAVAVIVAHNHPSGRLEPSPEYIDITRRLVEAGRVMGIQVLDHFVIGMMGRGRTRKYAWRSMAVEDGLDFTGGDDD